MYAGTSGFQSFLALIGRILISIVFIVGGIYKIVHYPAFAELIKSRGTSIGVANWWLVISIIFELLGGILVFLGYFTRFGALLLFIFVLVATPSFHSFWNVQKVVVGDSMFETRLWLKHLVVLGSCLYIMAFGAGRFGLDAFRRRAI